MEADFDRRGFIRRASVGAAAVGAMTVAGGTVFGEATANAATTAPDAPILDGTDVLAHVVNARTGELSVLVGEREIKLFNRELAQQIMRTTK